MLGEVAECEQDPAVILHRLGDQVGIIHLLGQPTQRLVDGQRLLRLVLEIEAVLALQPQQLAGLATVGHRRQEVARAFEPGQRDGRRSAVEIVVRQGDRHPRRGLVVADVHVPPERLVPDGDALDDLAVPPGSVGPAFEIACLELVGSDRGERRAGFAPSGAGEGGASRGEGGVLPNRTADRGDDGGSVATRRWWRGRARFGVGDIGDELVATPVHRADHRLGPAVVTERLTRRLDPAGQRRLGHESIAPDLVEQLLFADEPVVVLSEVGDHVEHLRLDGDRLPVAT
jgi:hypothetical protein